jgi:bacterial/archaeal transporter family protein
MRANDGRRRKGDCDVLAWVIPAAAFVVVIGLLGVTTKLALRHVTWPVIIVWTAIFYAVLSVILLITGAEIPWNEGTGLAILSGFMAATSLSLLFLALSIGDASRVVPAAAAYPAVTVIAAAILLNESLTIPRVAGTAIVVTGVILISIEAERPPEDEAA